MTFREFLAVQVPLAALFATASWLAPGLRPGLAFSVPGFALAFAIWYLYLAPGDRPGTGQGLTMEPLKPCPFCAGPARLIPTLPVGRWSVRCDDCDGRTWDFPAGPEGRGRAVAAWNRRDGDRCADGCVVERAVKEFNDSLGKN